MLTRLRALGRHGKPGDLQKVRLRYSQQDFYATSSRTDPASSCRIQTPHFVTRGRDAECPSSRGARWQPCRGRSSHRTRQISSGLASPALFSVVFRAMSFSGPDAGTVVRAIYAEHRTPSMRPTPNERKTEFPTCGPQRLRRLAWEHVRLQPFGSTASPTTNSRALRRDAARAWLTPLHEQSGYWSRRPSWTTSLRIFAMTNSPGWTLTPAESSQIGRPRSMPRRNRRRTYRGGRWARGPRVR